MSAGPRLRLMPMVMTAAGALLILKTIGLATHTSYLFIPAAKAESAPAPKAAEHAPSPANGAPSLPEDHGVKEGAGEKPGEGAALKADAKKAEAEKGPPPADPSPSEKALLEALQKRREALDTRSSDLDMREGLLKAAEKRLEDRLAELKRVEVSVSNIDVKRADEEKARIKNLVTLYEGMKVKEAAAIFDKLDADVLLSVSQQMKPAKLAEIMGKMSPDAAQKLTVALARPDASEKPAAVAASELPKIEGRPTDH